MPPKHRGSSTLTRTHSRGAMGNGSKQGLSALALTQKEATYAKPKKAAKVHSSQDLGGRRSQSRIHGGTREPRQSDVHVVHARDDSKKGFNLINPASDEDEWVNTSGGVTPNDRSDEDESEEESSIAPLVDHDQRHVFPTLTIAPIQRGLLTRTETAKQLQINRSQSPESYEHRYDRSSRVSTEEHVDLAYNSHHNDRRHSTQLYPQERQAAASKRNSFGRPPSTYSVKSEAPLRPRPLIRGQSYGITPVTLAPMSSSPALASGTISTSSSPEMTNAAPTILTRQSSIASMRSMIAAPKSPQNLHYDRSRTLSTMSSNSQSMQALQQIAGAQTQRNSHFVSKFPPQDANEDYLIHPLLPPPYIGAHLSVLRSYSPIRDSFARVLRAKQDVKAGA